ncbi:MAG: MATE family efflux transporter [Solobacterium sp.]|nr:MATE family efflux transporter [Solobacterium sp.]
MAENDLAYKMRNNYSMSLAERIETVIRLSLPTMLAMVSEIIMQYIDSAMVGSMGAGATASIGLVASSTWLVGNLLLACAYGFSVQIAHATGSGDRRLAGNIFRQSILTALSFSLLLCFLAVSAAFRLPAWLGADPSIWNDASKYFLIYALFLPVRQLYNLFLSSLQCTGNMKVPSMLGILCCFSDVVFNFFLIFPTRTVSLFGSSLVLPGAGLGVMGAALGTACAYLFAGSFLTYEACVNSEILNLRNPGTWRVQPETLKKAVSISVPMALEHMALTIAQVISTRIVAPLGTISLAANSFAVTAEGICYLPGFGIAAAATTLIGQAIGARRADLARSFAWLTTACGVVVMSLAGILMYSLCPYVFAFLTPVQEVRDLGVQVLRIELFAEPMFAASIVATGALRGAGDTLIPGILNLISMWGVRIVLALALVGQYGLPGIWTAMCIELNVRGILFLIRLARGKWLERAMAKQPAS